MRIPLQKLMLITALTIGSLLFVSTSAIAQAPGSIKVHDASITYYAQSGDTLITIAQRLTSKSSNWMNIRQANKINKDSRIPIGTPIVISADLLSDEPSVATVIARNGSITATAADGTITTLNIGSSITEGIRISTEANSFLTISLSDESRVSIPSNSSVLISKLRKSLYTASPRTEIKILRGRVVSRVVPLVNRGRFEVHTPLSVAGVRGTYFRVSLNNQKVTTEVLEGRVAVGSPQISEARLLPASKGNLITRESIGPAIDLLPPPTLAETPYLQEDAAKFNIEAIPNARAYHVQIAQDSEMLNLLAEGSSTTNIVAINNIPEGRYFVRIAAIDKFSLEGMPQITAANIKNRDATKAISTQAAPSVADGNFKELVLRWQGSDNQKYNVQVARDLNFSWLVFNTSVTGNEIKLPRPSFGTYFARVQSINSDGGSNSYSYAQTLIVTDQWIINDGPPLHAKEMSRNTSR